MSINVFITIASINSCTGGPARSVPFLCEAIYRAGAKVQLFAKDNEIKVQHISNCTTISRGNDLASPTFFPIDYIHNLGKSVKEKREHYSKTILIHNHGIWLPINHTVVAIARRYNVPLIISPRGMLEPWALNYKSWKKKIAWSLYQHKDLKSASLLHATSEQEANNFQSLGFKMPIAVIPNGLNIPEYIEYEQNNKNKKTVLFLSRIHHVKGLINLVRAWAEVKPDNWEVIIAGPDEGGHKTEVEQEIKRNRLIDIFKFIGQVDDKYKWDLYRNADIFVLPTHSENFGIVVAEALASGVPVITTKGAPWKELEDHNCGWWVDIGVEPLVKALKEATDLSTEARHEMGQRGRLLVEQNYSWDKIGKEMLSVYEWVLHGGAPPSCVVLD